MLNFLYIFSAAPHGGAQGQETLDAALIGAAFEQKVSLLFVHDGVFQLKSDQQLAASGLRHYTKTFKALEDFGVEHIYVHEPSLLARGLVESDLIIPVKTLNRQAVSQVLNQQARVFNLS